MPNKTLYIRERDLALWDLAQAQLGQSLSALFAEFLRERVPVMDVFVHVVRSAPNSQDFTVMFAPTGPSGSGGPMNPHYIQGQQLTAFLESRGVSRNVAAGIASDLQTTSSVSVRTVLLQRQYTLSFAPTLISESGAPRLLIVNVIGQEVSGGGSRWVRSYHGLDQLINDLEYVLGLPAQQLASIRQLLLSGSTCFLGGRESGATYVVVGEEQLMQLGLVEERPDLTTPA
jgi:hypothetical protein